MQEAKAYIKIDLHLKGLSNYVPILPNCQLFKKILFLIDLLHPSLLLKSKKFVLNISVFVNIKRADREKKKCIMTQEKMDWCD